MHKAIRNLDITPEFLLIDGNYFTPYQDDTHYGREIPCNCVVGGDDSYYSIAAASILAKDYHTKMIKKLVNNNSKLLLYDIHNNKGYGTKKHINALKEYGLTEFHRKTFGICKNMA